MRNYKQMFAVGVVVLCLGIMTSLIGKVARSSSSNAGHTSSIGSSGRHTSGVSSGMGHKSAVRSARIPSSSVSSARGLKSGMNRTRGLGPSHGRNYDERKHHRGYWFGRRWIPLYYDVNNCYFDVFGIRICPADVGYIVEGSVAMPDDCYLDEDGTIICPDYVNETTLL